MTLLQESIIDRAADYVKNNKGKIALGLAAAAAGAYGAHEYNKHRVHDMEPQYKKAHEELESADHKMKDIQSQYNNKIKDETSGFWHGIKVVARPVIQPVIDANKVHELQHERDVKIEKIYHSVEPDIKTVKEYKSINGGLGGKATLAAGALGAGAIGAIAGRLLDRRKKSDQKEVPAANPSYR